MISSTIRFPRAPMAHLACDGDAAIHPFRPFVPQVEVAELQHRIASRRRTGGMVSTSTAERTRLEYIDALADYWGVGYDWRVHEAALRALPHFVTTILGQRFHFVHSRSAAPDAIPLLLLHGWPGSVAELTRVIGPLRDPGERTAGASDAFHLVAPSLPGFGWSVPFAEPGWGNPFRVATALAELMERLGYSRFGVHGASVGACVAATSGVLSPDRVIGVHLGAPALFPYGNSLQLDHDIVAATFASAVLDRFLADSPTALLAWMVEQFVRAVDAGPAAFVELDRDQLLTNASLYWFTGTAATSTEFVLGATRTYDTFVATSSDRVAASPASLMLPRAGARLAHEASLPPWTEFDGGHTPAMTMPDLLVHDIRAFFRTRRLR